MKNVIFSIFTLSFLTLQSCVPPAPCNGCGNGGSGNNGNGYNSSQLYEGDVITAQVMAYPNSSYSVSLDIDFNGGTDYIGTTNNVYTLNDIQDTWTPSNLTMVTGYVKEVYPKVVIQVNGVLAGSYAMEQGSEFEIQGEVHVVCFVTEDLEGVTLPNKTTLRVLRLKSKISELQDMDDEK